MTMFLRLLADSEKEDSLSACCERIRSGVCDGRLFEVVPETFHSVPGAPFAYWVSDAVRALFQHLDAFGDNGRQAQRALSTNNDFRYLRLWWERQRNFAIARPASGWFPFAKGGAYSPYYSDIPLIVNWIDEGREIEADACQKFPNLGGNAEWVLHREANYLKPGLTWSLRTKSRLSMRILPRGCLFGHKGPAAFVPEDNESELFCLLAVCSSDPFHKLVELQLAAADARPGGAAHSFEVGVIQKTPVPRVDAVQRDTLAARARRAWMLKRELDTVAEASHAFLLPKSLRSRVGAYEISLIEVELAEIQANIDATVFDLYGFEELDRPVAAALPANPLLAVDGDDDGEDSTSSVNEEDALSSWAAGVAFGRFDCRLATGERAAPLPPQPFDALPAKSPGMVPDGAAPFHTHAGILVDDPGHKHDLAHLIEEVLIRVNVPMPSDARRWLQRDFFPFHLQNYSKSRRKAPIYWPLSTASGAYTLWVYYPGLTGQTLYTAVNDFLDGPAGKLKQVEQEAAALRAKTTRSRNEDKKLEALQNLQAELIDLHDTLLRIAPTYHPNHDDGVQITAAPLWPLFRHKPWQKILKDTWAKLEKGDYDWAHLALSYWPDRVREKCKTDKSLAIAHDLEALYVEPEQKAAKPRGQKKGGEA